MKKINFSAYNPIIRIEDNLVFSNNGNIILCYKGNLPEIYTLAEKDFDDLHGTWFQSLKTLPTGTVIHKQDVYLKKKFTSEKLRKTTFLEKSTHNYFKNREYLQHECYLFFSYSKNKFLNNSKFTNPFRKIEKGIENKLELDANEFILSVKDSIQFLNNSRKMSFQPIKENEILEITSMFFNGFISDVETDIVLDKENINIGENYFDILAINNEQNFGEQISSCKKDENFTSDDFTFYQGFIDGIGLKLNHNHVVNQIVYLDDKHKWRKILEKRKDELSKSKNFGTQNASILKKVEKILTKINDDENSRIIRGHLNVIFWDNKKENLSRIASKIKTEFKELDLKPYYPKSEERKNYFLNSFFCYNTNLSNEDLYVTDLKHSLCMFINNSNYKSDDKGIVFNDRQFNIPVLKDVWDEAKKRIKARNFAIFAPTGEGKSFLANSILRQFYEQNVRLVLIDLGGSYGKLAALYPDDHIILKYETGKNLGINPFFISNKKDLTAERLEDIAVFLFELISDGKKVEKTENVSLKKILKYYYEQVEKNHSLPDMFDFIEHRKETLLSDLKINKQYFDIENFLHILSEYVRDGIYSFLFEVKEDQSYKLEDKRFIVFELDEVKDNKEILSVMLKLIKSAIQRTIWQNKSERGIILFDEFAKQLKFGNVLESVEFYYQAIRKQNGAIGIILQSINQLPVNHQSASILENTQVFYSLRNQKGYKDLVERLNLSEHDHNQLKSIKNNFIGDIKYTELLQKIGSEANIVRLEVPPEVYAAYLTDGKESEEIMSDFRETNSMETSIVNFVNKRKNVS